MHHNIHYVNHATSHNYTVKGKSLMLLMHEFNLLMQVRSTVQLYVTVKVHCNANMILQWIILYYSVVYFLSLGFSIWLFCLAFMGILLALYWTFSHNSSHVKFVLEKGLDFCVGLNFLYWIKSFRKIETNFKRKIYV